MGEELSAQQPAKSWDDVVAELTGEGQLFEMRTRDVRGVPLRTWVHAPESLRTLVEISKLHGEVPMSVYEGESLTYTEHFARTAALAHRLIDEYGIGKGDRVAIAMRNFPEWTIAFFAATCAGAVAVPLNAWWSADELEFGLRDSGSRVLIADGERAERLRDKLPGLDVAVIVARPDGELPPGAREFASVIGAYDGDDGAALPDVALEPDDNATIFYTSGTTGRPKGALGTHRNICGNILCLAYGMLAGALRDGHTVEEALGSGRRVTLLTVPLFHATGCHAVLATTVFTGGTLVLMYKWDPERALELIAKEKVSTFSGVPTMAWQMLSSPRFAAYDTSSLTGVSYGGAPAPPKLVDRIRELLPNRTPSNGYGLTETSSVSTYNSGVDYVQRPESVGRPVAVVDVKVVGADGADLPEGEVGELWIKGPNIVAGYWNRPDATAAAFTDGWFHSGDLARVDAEGFVYIVDRAKDMLIRGGENVYCAEVEAALYEHPAVADAAVIGVPDDVLGEEVGAVLVLNPGTELTLETLRAYLKDRIAPFKIPSHLWIRQSELPRNAGGKILKTRLRSEILP
ncbi:MAG TPA: class I adenylate-forming enzyme family protein [Streptosporangiaceae bacterium]